MEAMHGSHFLGWKIPTFSYFSLKIPTFSYILDHSYHLMPWTFINESLKTHGPGFKTM